MVALLAGIARSIDRVVGVVVVFLLVVMLVTTSAGVFWRYILNSALSWSEELGRYLLVWVSFLGAALATYRGAHIGIQAFLNLLPAPLQIWIGRVVDALIILFMAAILLGGIEILPATAIRIAPTLSIRMNIPYLVLPISAGIILFDVLVHLVEGFTKQKAEP